MSMLQNFKHGFAQSRQTTPYKTSMFLVDASVILLGLTFLILAFNGHPGIGMLSGIILGQLVLNSKDTIYGFKEMLSPSTEILDESSRLLNDPEARREVAPEAADQPVVHPSPIGAFEGSRNGSAGEPLQTLIQTPEPAGEATYRSFPRNEP